MEMISRASRASRVLNLIPEHAVRMPAWPLFGRCGLRVAAVILLFLGALPPCRADVQAGNAAYTVGDYETAYQEWLSAAEAGSAQAQFNVGLLFQYGQGRAVDLGEAAAWYLKSADGGFDRAQYAIAEMYESGIGVKKDAVQARKWFKLAGKQKYKDARKRRNRLAKTMTPEEIALGDMWAREWERAREQEKGSE
jgi:hypothetical protein